MKFEWKSEEMNRYKKPSDVKGCELCGNNDKSLIISEGKVWKYVCQSCFKKHYRIGEQNGKKN